ncbi:restriction endonuclease subunit S [Acinetobacter baumannii]
MASPKLRFKEFGSGWNSIAIGTFLKIKSGLGFKAEEYTTAEEIRLLQIENVGYGTVKWTHNVKYVPSDYLKLHEGLVLKEGDLVLALNRPVTNDQLKIAKLTKQDSPSILYQRVGKLEFIKEEFDSNFIFQIFQKDVKNYVLNGSLGSDQPFISTTDLYKYKLCLPSKEEQTKIASFLSTVDEKIAQLTQKHELLSQYKQGMMQKLFSQQIRFKADDGSEFGEWEEIKLGDIASKVGSGSTPRGGAEAYTEDGIIFIRSQNVNNNQLLLDDVVYIPEQTHKKMSGSKVVANDILLNITGASIGRSCVVPMNFTEANVNQHVCIIRTPNDNPRFIQSFLASKDGQNLIDSHQTGSGREGLNFQSIRSFTLNRPCLEEQTQIANFLSAIDQKIEKVAQQIEETKQWKKGLLQQMFV